MDEQNVFENRQNWAEDLFIEATFEEFFGNHLCETQEECYYLFPTTHVGDSVWLIENRPKTKEDEYEVQRVKDANKQHIIPRTCSFHHCVPIARTLIDDKRNKDIEEIIKNGGKYLAQKINKAFADVLAESVSETIQVQGGQIDAILADVFSKQVKDGFHPNKFLFPEHLEAKLVQQKFIVRDQEIQNHHYVGKTVTGQQAFWSTDLPTGTAILFDSTVGIILIKKTRVSIEKLKGFNFWVCGDYGANLIVKNTNGIIAIEGVDQVFSKNSGNISIANPALSSQLCVDPTRLDELREIKSTEYDLSKLIQLCEELNKAYTNQCYYSVAMLLRAVLDHVPPIFRYKSFLEVANNYGGSKSLKRSLQNLQKSSRNIADSYLHLPVRKKEALPNKTQVNFSNDLDVLLQELVRLLK